MRLTPESPNAFITFPSRPNKFKNHASVIQHVEHFPEFAKPFFQIHVCATTQARNCSVMRLFLNKQNKQLGSLYNSLASQGNEGKQSRSYRKIVPIKFFSPNARMYRKSLSFIASLRNSARRNKKFNLF